MLLLDFYKLEYPRSLHVKGSKALIPPYTICEGDIIQELQQG